MAVQNNMEGMERILIKVKSSKVHKNTRNQIQAYHSLKEM
jgi:hypothetical protein